MEESVVHMTGSINWIYTVQYSGLRLIWPPRAIITGWIYYPEFLFSKKSKFLYKSGHINRLDMLSLDILSGVYCSTYEVVNNLAYLSSVCRCLRPKGWCRRTKNISLKRSSQRARPRFGGSSLRLCRLNPTFPRRCPLRRWRLHKIHNVLA